MNISEIFTKKNLEIIKLIGTKPDYVREIATKLNMSPATVHKFSKKLKEANMLKEKKYKNRIILSLQNKNPIIKQIRAILNYQELKQTKTYNKLKQIGRIGIYGSFAQGTNDSLSDIDMWIITNKKESELRPLIRELERELKTRVNPLILSQEKINSLKKEDSEFFIRLKLISMGDEFKT